MYFPIFLLFFLTVTDKLPPNYFRGLHCGILSGFSFANSVYFREKIIDPKVSLYDEQPIINISLYLIFYIFFDLKNCVDRADLLIHHIFVLLWAVVNFGTGITSFCIINEIISTAYFISSLLPQMIYRMLCITFIRFPVWLTVYYSNYYFYENYDYYRNIFNASILNAIIYLDMFWFVKYIEKVYRLKNTHI